MAASQGCKKSGDAQTTGSGVLLRYQGCKITVADGANQANQMIAPSNTRDCVYYQYDGNGTLTLNHIDAAFNCCPGEITADILIDGKQITITEKESAQDCLCLCLYDLDYEFINLEPGDYTIRIIEPYKQEADLELEFTISLSSAASGSYCLTRDYYPWVAQ
jgi:hypothetical protein